MKEKEIIWNKTLKLRNELQQKCLKNKHSYLEEIKINIPDGITIETVIGGRVNGNINWSSIYPDDDWCLQIATHIHDSYKNYEEHSDQIIKDLK